LNFVNWQQNIYLVKIIETGAFLSPFIIKGKKMAPHKPFLFSEVVKLPLNHGVITAV